MGGGLEQEGQSQVLWRGRVRGILEKRARNSGNASYEVDYWRVGRCRSGGQLMVHTPKTDQVLMALKGLK